MNVLNTPYMDWVTMSSFLDFNTQHSCKWNKTFRFLSVQILAVTPRGSPQALSKKH